MPTTEQKPPTAAAQPGKKPRQTAAEWNARIDQSLAAWNALPEAERMRRIKAPRP
jgi:hypothetical protein